MEADWWAVKYLLMLHLALWELCTNTLTHSQTHLHVGHSQDRGQLNVDRDCNSSTYKQTHVTLTRYSAQSSRYCIGYYTMRGCITKCEFLKSTLTQRVYSYFYKYTHKHVAFFSVRVKINILIRFYPKIPFSWDINGNMGYSFKIWTDT